jgi:hypothetical protein
MERDKQDKSLADAIAFAEKYCNPDDSKIISEIDIHARESAWQLLNRLRNNEEITCSKCSAAVAEQAQEEIAATEPSKLEKISAETEEILAQASSFEVKSTNFFDHIKQKAKIIGLAGLISIASGAYFQVGVIKEKGAEIIQIAEKEYGLVTKLNQFLISTFGSSFAIQNNQTSNSDDTSDNPPSEIIESEDSNTNVPEVINPPLTTDPNPPTNQ